jgi:predicted transcriptional regulator
MKIQTNVGRAEMEVLRYVSTHHPVTVGAVAAHFATTKGQVRTTILNVMERLRKKGFLTRKRVGGLYEYSVRLPRAELFRRLVHTFVQNTLGGSVSPFVAYLTEDAVIDDTELAELKKLVRQLEGRRNSHEHAAPR